MVAMLFLGVLCLALGALAHPTFYMPRTAFEYPMSFPYYPKVAIVEADEKLVPGIPEAPKLDPLSSVKEVTIEEFKEGDWRLEEDKEEENLEKYDDGQYKGEEVKEEEGQWKDEELKEEEGQWKGEEVKEEEVIGEVIEPIDKEDEEVIESKEKEDGEENEKYSEEEKTEDESKKPVVVELDGPKLPEFITNLWANRPSFPHITLPTINFPFSLPSFFPKTRTLVPTADIPYIVGTSRVRILDKN
ncbi:unnamed protein product [Diatraea saccharalis]|uniref:Uncharacterized protein n=1 Tax=Diatraea saccharalis TaxID=40085 RepID=A0A9N9WCE3_9NEOP|nr:unnamed protein product [Diatraea saccharalis]